MPELGYRQVFGGAVPQLFAVRDDFPWGFLRTVLFHRAFFRYQYPPPRCAERAYALAIEETFWKSIYEVEVWIDSSFSTAAWW
jgi:hypothetical protein